MPEDIEETTLASDDVLCSVMVLAKRQSGKDPFFVEANGPRLQEIFYEMSGSGHTVLEGFVFSPNGPVPYSPVLEESLNRLQFSGFVSRRDPKNPDNLYVNPPAEKYTDRFMALETSPDQREEFIRVADQFLEYFV